MSKHWVPDDGMAFGTWLLVQIAERGWNQNRFAKRIGVNNGSVSKWCSGRARPGPAACHKIAAALGFEPEVVLRRTGQLAANGAVDPARSRRDEFKALIDHVALTPDRVATLAAILNDWNARA